jgi:hypothetical protein
MVPLGALGSLEHYRCRDCGAQDSQERDDLSDDDMGMGAEPAP